MDPYFKLPGLNASLLKHMLHSPLRFKRALDGEHKVSTDATKLGSAIHCLVLEADRFSERYVVMPQFELHEGNVTATGKRTTSKNTKFYKGEVEVWQKANAGLCFLKAAELELARKVAANICNHPKMVAIQDKRHETEVVVQSRLQGVGVKSKLDLVRTQGHPLLLDLKTCADCSPHAFGRQFANLRYGFQLAMYRYMFQQKYGKEPTVAVLAAETGGDFDVAYYRVPAPVLDNGFMQVQQAIIDYKKWKSLDSWPGVDRGRDALDLYVPQWAMEDSGDELLEGFEAPGDEVLEEQEMYF